MICKKKQPIQKPQVKPSGQQPPAKGAEAYHEEEDSAGRDGSEQKHSSGSGTTTVSPFRIEQLRPLMLTLAGEVAKAATVDWDEDQLGLMVEATLSLHGVGHLSKVQKDLPPTPSKNLRLDLPRHLP